MSLSRGERFAEARTSYNQHGTQTMDEVAAATGLTKSMISDLESDDKDRKVGYQAVAILAKYYGVSSDFLLGLSPNPTTDKGLDAICQYTGLNENSINYLHFLVDVHSGNTIHPKALDEIEQMKAEKDSLTDGSRLDFYCEEYSDPDSDWVRRADAKKYGVEDDNDVVAIAKAKLADVEKWAKLSLEANSEHCVGYYQQAAIIPINALNVILASENEKEILTNLSLFLQLDDTQRYNSKEPFEITIGSHTDEGMGFMANLSPDILAWGFLKKAENALAELRSMYSGKLLIDEIM